MFNDFANKVFRDAFLEENIKTRLALQVRALREKAGWSQPQLGERTGHTQSGISRIEDPNYGKFTIRTLLKLASAFDVALFISFVPYTKLIREIKDVSPEALAVASYKEEKKAMEEISSGSFVIVPTTAQLGIEGYAPTTAENAGLPSQNENVQGVISALKSAQPQTAPQATAQALADYQMFSSDLPGVEQYMRGTQGQFKQQSIGAR